MALLNIRQAVTLWAGLGYNQRTFQNPHFQMIGASQLIEEETFPDYLAERCYQSYPQMLPCGLCPLIWNRNKSNE